MGKRTDDFMREDRPKDSICTFIVDTVQGGEATKIKFFIARFHDYINKTQKRKAKEIIAHKSKNN